MKLPNNLYSRLTLLTTTTLVVGYFVVYAWTTLDPVDAGPTKTLTATLMQGIVNNINDLNTRVLNFGFSAGNVGIGTASPLRKLHVSGDWIIADNTYGLLGLNTTGGQKIISQIRNDNSYGFGESALVITDAGNVGIGTSSPSVRLDVAGDTKSSRFYSINVTTASTPSGVPVTIYNATGQYGLYLVSVDNYGDPVHYGAFAVVTVGSTGAKVLYNVGNVYMAGITTSGSMIQATQSSGAATTITATLTKLQ